MRPGGEEQDSLQQEKVRTVAYRHVSEVLVLIGREERRQLRKERVDLCDFVFGECHLSARLIAGHGRAARAAFDRRDADFHDSAPSWVQNPRWEAL
jgi:hypothetical protein